MSKRLGAHGAPLALAILALAGCASEQSPPQTAIPIAAAYPASAQQKMQAAHHWEVLAADMARQIGPSAKSAGRAIYVTPQGPRSPFSDAFRGMLAEALVNEGVAVSASPSGALTLAYGVQVVGHQAPRKGFAGPASDPPTNAEAIVSAEIVDGGRVAFKTNRIYYLNPEDALAQYQPPPGRPVIPTQPRAVRVGN
jgi:hypothetical protein